MPNGSVSTPTFSSSNDATQSTMDSDEHRPTTTDQRKKKTPSSQRVSRAKKSGLVFSVARVENRLRKGRYADRISPSASVYLASTLEYLVAEIVELAGDLTLQGGRKRLTPRDIALVIKNDHELSKLCADVTIPQGGVQPFIHQSLLVTKPRSKPRKITPVTTVDIDLSDDEMDNSV